MSTALTLARPYARAAVSLAREQGRLQSWSEGLAFAASIAADPVVKSLLTSPAMNADAAITLLSPESGADPEFDRLLRMLMINRRLPLLPEISQLFELARAEAEHVVNVTITSATVMDDSEVDAISSALRRRFGTEVSLTRRVDPDLIGGAIIDAGDVVIDGSLRGKLERLRTTLAH